MNHPGLLAISVVSLLIVCSLGPGLIIVSRLRWSPLEKLWGALGFSFIATYLASFGLFCLNANSTAYFAVSGTFAAMTIAGRRQLFQFFRWRPTRRVILAYLIVVGWEFLHLAMVRVYSGGDWANDWWEHYDRTRFFLNLLPKDFLYLDVYALPARPPLMNLICAFYCKQVGMSFEAYSLVNLFLNSMTFIPCCLLLRFLGRRGGRALVPLTILFMLNPSIVEHATYTITKAFAAAWVVGGVCFYLSALRHRADSSRLTAAAMFLAAGLLVHYSAAPYAVAVGVHYLWMLVRRRDGLRQAIIVGGAAALLITTWWGWLIVTFGVRASLFSMSTTTVLSAREGPSKVTVGALCLNLFYNIVPHPFHPAAARAFPPGWTWVTLRDYFFMMSQTTLPMMIGTLGGIVVVILLLRRRPRLRYECHFWIWFAAVALICGTLTIHSSSLYGAANMSLQSLALLGLTLLAANIYRLGPALFGMVLAGSAIDYALGILLQFDRESYVFQIARDANGGTAVLADPNLGQMAAGQYAVKLAQHYTFWGDHLAGVSIFLETASVIVALALLCWLFHWWRQSRRIEE